MSALATQTRTTALSATAEPEGFDFSNLRVFDAIPKYRHDVVVMRGLVVVFDTYLHNIEPIQMGAIYVRESQRPPSAMPWELWLESEWRDRDRRAGPYSRLSTRREVVQAREWPYAGDRAWKMDNGMMDGPIYDWAFGQDIIGKVVGIYAPGGVQ